MQILNRYINTFISLLLIAISGCRGNISESIDIILPDNQHLEDTKSGWWIKNLNIKYNNDLFLDDNISKRLEQIGKLQDTYTEKKGFYVKRWYVKENIILEKWSFQEGNKIISFELLLSDGGIPFQKLVGEKAFQLKHDGEGMVTVIIRSKRDNCRLFLHGYGKYCTTISLMTGA